jgi:hypothetical protein
MDSLLVIPFNEKWSIESGLLWDTKRVYDNGSYFNPPGIHQQTDKDNSCEWKEPSL